MLMKPRKWFVLLWVKVPIKLQKMVSEISESRFWSLGSKKAQPEKVWRQGTRTAVEWKIRSNLIGFRIAIWSYPSMYIHALTARKYSGRWVPHELSPEKKQWRFDMAMSLLTWIKKNDFAQNYHRWWKIGVVWQL